MLQAVERALSRANVRTDYIQPTGGIDEESPPFERKPGTAQAAINFEAIPKGGYRRCAGYERKDGQPRPSDAEFLIVEVTFTRTIDVDDVVTGATSTETAQVIAVVNQISDKYIVVTKVTGDFTVGETLTVSGTSVAIVRSITVSAATLSLETKATYKHLAANAYRADIEAVPGSGPILGVVEFAVDEDGAVPRVYAFRNNAGGTQAKMYVGMGTGWEEQPLPRELAFTSGGTTEIEVGNLIEGATSGALNTVLAVIVTSGTWAAGTAAGRLVLLTGQTGSFVAENLNVGANLNVATVAGNSTQVTLAPGGKYEFIIENFGGARGTRNLYGVSGKNRGFEFGFGGYIPISTGMTDDKPTHVHAHKKHLCFSFGPSFQHSAPGEPHVWSPILGASEIALGDDITGFDSQSGNSGGGSLAIFSRNSTHMLYGSGVSDWVNDKLKEEIGAYPYTIQNVGFSMFLDDRGITDLQTSQNYGNFDHNSISEDIKTSLNLLRQSVTTSCISRDRSQYRLFFSTGNAYYITMRGRKVVGIMPMYFDAVANVAWSGETVDGIENIYIGGMDGFVYQLDKGTSFDGEDINAYFDLAYNFQRSPRQDKSYLDTTIEVNSKSYAVFNLGYKLGYASGNIPQPTSQNFTIDHESSRWDEFTWDDFVWDTVSLSPSTVETNGDAENIAFMISSSSAILEPFDITAIVVNYIIRKRLRP